MRYPAILTNALVPQPTLSSILQNQLGVALDALTVSSHRSVLPENLIAPLTYRITKGGVRRNAVPSRGARQKEGWRRIVWRR